MCAGCPNVPGYIMDEDQQYEGGDILCDGRVGVETLASRCSTDGTCRGFSYWTTAGQRGAGCTKANTGLAVSLPGVCTYTLIKTGTYKYAISTFWHPNLALHTVQGSIVYDECLHPWWKGMYGRAACGCLSSIPACWHAG